MHMSTATRPDIAAAVRVLSQYVKPKLKPLDGCETVLQHL